MPGDQEIDEDLLNMLHVARTKEVQFALVMKGGADGALLLEKFKIPPQLIAAAKKRTGGSAVLQGRCFFEDGKYIFAMEKTPPATAVAVVKKVVKRDTGLTIHAEFRFAGATAPGPTADDPATSALKKRLADVRREVEQAAAKSDHAAPLVKMLAKIDEIVATDGGRASSLLQQLEQSCREYAAWRPVNNAIADKFALLRSVPQSPAKKALNIKLQEYGSQLENGSYSAARDTLKQLEPAIDKLLSDAKIEVPPASSSAPEKPASEVRPSVHLLADWQAASKTAAEQVVQLLGVLRNTKIPALEAMGQEMLATTRKYVTAMQTVLADYEHATGDDKLAAAKKSLELAKACKTRIPGEKLLVGADSNPFGVHATVCQTLGHSLDEVIAGLL